MRKLLHLYFQIEVLNQSHGKLHLRKSDFKMTVYILRNEFHQGKYIYN